MDQNLTAQPLHDLSILLRDGVPAGLDDGQLLERFQQSGDAAEAAFAELVRRHGPMVLSACRRQLGDTHAAEDAFQATFLALAFRARSISRRDTVAPWLYRVASRLARRIRHATRKQRNVSTVSTEIAAAPPEDDLVDLRRVLHEELAQLPDKYQRPLTLCYLDGLTQNEAALLLGWTKGTVSGRLARAKEQLRTRLIRRGLAPAVATTAIASGVEAAALPASHPILAATAQAAVAAVHGFSECRAASASVINLSRATLRSMFFTRMRAVAAIAATALVGGAIAIEYARAVAPPIPVAAPANQAAEPPLPEGARTRMGTTFLRHEDDVYCATFAPNGRILASAGRDGAVRFWDAKTGAPMPGLPVLREGASPTSIDFSPDGRLLAIGRELGILQVWNVAENREHWHTKAGKARVAGLAFASDSLTLASSTESDKSVRIWDVATGTERQTLPVDAKAARLGPLSFSPDGRRLVLGFVAQGEKRDGMICIWDLRNPTRPVLIRGAHGHGIKGIAFTKSGETLVSCGEEIRRINAESTGKDEPQFVPVPHLAHWDARDGRRLWEFEPPGVIGLRGFALTHDGGSIVSSHSDRLLVWDLATGQITRAISFASESSSSPYAAVAISSDDQTLSVLRTDHAIRLLDFATGQSVTKTDGSHNASVVSVAFSPDGRFVASSAWDNKMCLWDTAKGSMHRALELGGRGTGESTSISFDGRTLAAAGQRVDPSLGFQGILRLWKWDDGRLIREIILDHRATLVSFSPDNLRVAVATWDGQAEFGPMSQPAGPRHNTVRVVDVASGQTVAEMSGDQSKVIALAFAGDGKTFVTVSQDLSFRRWDVEGQKQIQQLPITGYNDGPMRIASAAISPDLKWAATSGQWTDRLVIWDLISGKAAHAIEAAGNLGAILAFSHDGRWLASAPSYKKGSRFSDGRIRFWNPATGQECGDLSTGGSAITSLAFSPDGQSLATGMANTTILTWKIPPLDRANTPEL